MMVKLHRRDGAVFGAVKGTPEPVIARADRVRRGGVVFPLGATGRADWPARHDIPAASLLPLAIGQVALSVAGYRRRSQS